MNDNLILDRMQRLMVLGLDGQPAAEVITGTARLWQKILGNVDPRRLNAAFDTIEATAKRWPTPAVIRESLPAYDPPVPRSHRIAPDRSGNLSVQAEIDKLAKFLGLGRKDVDDKA